VLEKLRKGTHFLDLAELLPEIIERELLLGQFAGHLLRLLEVCLFLSPLDQA